MDFRKVILCVFVSFMVLVPSVVSWSIEGQEQIKSESSLSQEDLEIIKNLDLLENLPLLNEEDLSMFAEPEFDVSGEK